MVSKARDITARSIVDRDVLGPYKDPTFVLSIRSSLGQWNCSANERRFH